MQKKTHAFIWFSKIIPLETEKSENDLLLGSHKTRFFSYERTVLRIAIERDLSLKQIITKR